MNYNKEMFEWTDKVEEDDLEFQGLLENKLHFPDISAKLPKVDLESQLPVTAVKDEPEPSYMERVDEPCLNANINPDKFRQTLIVEAEPNKVGGPCLSNLFVNIKLTDELIEVYPTDRGNNDNTGLDPPQIKENNAHQEHEYHNDDDDYKQDLNYV